MKVNSQMFNRIRQWFRKEDGGALAELAIMVPFLVLMLAGVSEFGRYFQNYTTLAKATRNASRYLSNHELNAMEEARAVNLVVCGKLACGVGDPPLVKGLSSANVCLESTGSPKVLSVTVKIPYTAANCTPIDGTAAATPYTYTPIFDIGALLEVPSFSMALPIAPSTTMYYMID
jgi:TadE-like protein